MVGIRTIEDQLDVNIVWMSKDELSVFYPAGTGPQVKTTWKDVRISFEKQ
jgi:hypothetical protein